jgi:hypothetical protein
MASIILSFVGQQDPVSDHTREDGSIVSLLRHLVTTQNTIKQVMLLYTSGKNGTQERAELTQGWLMDAPFHLPQDAIALVPVGDGLSNDPVDLFLAVQAARQGLEMAIAQCNTQDTLEFNASSGTPVMKSTWSILQAAGYAPRSRLWQVRNPKEQQTHQARVFQTNIQVLRQEFDIRVIQQQLQAYNYNGALATLKSSGLSTPLLEAMLIYGHCRLSLDFASAKEAIAPVDSLIHHRWSQEVKALLHRNALALLREAYFNSVVELKNQKFSDFLVRVSQFQEKALQHFVNEQLSGYPQLPRSFEATKTFWDTLSHRHPDLYQFLVDYRFRGNPLRLERFPNRPTLIAILEHGRLPVLDPLQTLNSYCEQRNQYIHQFEGISDMDGVDEILKTMRLVLEHLGYGDFTNPFNVLNQEILEALNAERP